ncbi:MAG: hypothetical protein WCJ61_00010 [Paludibacter sp.]
MKTKIIVITLLLATNALFSKENIPLKFQPQWSETGTNFRHTWEGMGNVDQFRWFVRRDMQDQIAEANKNLKMKHVRAVGMFDDELRIFALDPQTWRTPTADRKPRYNWQVVDYCIQSLLDRGVNPMITTCFTPEAMASGQQYCFTTRANVTPPKDYNQWADLITKTVQHFVERFGENTVKCWYFEVWNEPNLDAFWKAADKQEYFKLWNVTSKAIKSVNPAFRVGGPSAARAEWIKEFIEYGRANQCEPDYIITHVYNNDSPFAALSPFAGPQTDKINDSPNFLPGVVKGTRKLLDEMGFKGELHFNEWGRSWFPSDAIRESENEAAFIAKSMAESSQYADYFAYWCLSDIYDQLGYNAETFAGNYGMMNLQGLKKPSYKAFQLLTKLGDKQLTIKSENATDLSNAIATKSKNGHQFLFYSFSKEFHPDSTASKKVRISVLLPKNATKNKIQIFQIGNTENNVVTAWKKMQKPAYLNKSQLAKLQKMNVLQPTKEAWTIKKSADGNYLEIAIDNPGVCLINIL